MPPPQQRPSLVPHPPAPPSSPLQVPSHSMTPDLADPRNIARRHVVGELSVLCPQASDLVSLMMKGCKPCGNCTVSIFLCPDYVICCPVYKSDPLYGLDLSLLLKGLTLQRYPVPRVHPGPPIAGLHPGMDSDNGLNSCIGPLVTTAFTEGGEVEMVKCQVECNRLMT